MDFTPPGFQTLLTNTQNLGKKLDTIYNRFKLPYTEINLLPTSNSNSTLFLFSQSVFTMQKESKTDKTQDIDVFTKLIDEFRPLSNEADNNQIRAIILLILGALLHRYFRIINDYATMYKFKSLFSGPYSCELFCDIRKLLGLPPIEKNNAKTYQQDDLIKLDVTTVVEALMIFKDHMLEHNKETKAANYKRYHALNTNNFEPQLEEIIKEQKKRENYLPRKMQYSGIRFIQSLILKFDNDRLNFEIELQKWVIDLKYKLYLKDAKPEAMSKHLEAYITNALISLDAEKDNERIKKLNSFKRLLMPLLKSNSLKKFLDVTEGLSFQSIQEKLAGLCSSHLSHLSTAAYLTLIRSSDCSDDLKTCLEGALGMKSNTKLDDDYQEGIFSNLKSYFETNDTRSLDYNFWGTESDYTSHLSNMHKKYASELRTPAS